MARPRIRSIAQLHVFSPWTTTGWRRTRIIGVAEGERKVELGVFRRVYDAMTGNHVGYQPVEKPAPVTNSSDPSRAALGVRETLAIAGALGASRTAHLSEREKQEAVMTGRLTTEEDFVERVENLVAAYTESANFADLRVKRRGLAPGGDRAVRVYPKAVMV